MFLFKNNISNFSFSFLFSLHSIFELFEWLSFRFEFVKKVRKQIYVECRTFWLIEVALIISPRS